MSKRTECDFCKKTKNFSIPNTLSNQHVPGWGTLSLSIRVTADRDAEIVGGSGATNIDICPECLKEKNFPIISYETIKEDPIREAIFDLVAEALENQGV